MVKKLILNFLKKRGLHIRKATNRNMVLQLLDKLQPLTTNIELVRLGASTDGGYLLPNDLEDIYACYSPGVGKMSLFEKDCLELGMELYLADYSVDKPGYDDERLHFLKKYIGAQNNDVFITMEEWVKGTSIGLNKDLMLQMDIEGYEFQTILNMSDSLISKFRIIVIEFHHFNNLWNAEAFMYMSTAFEKLLKNHYCIHVHPNNCCGVDMNKGIELPIVAEFTFIRKDRVKKIIGAAQLPHKLDIKNTPKPDLLFDGSWFKVQ